MQICKEKIFLVGGEGTPLPESQNFWDILGKNLVIFYKFSRFISEKINPCYQNVFQLMCEKKNFIGFTLFRGGVWTKSVKVHTFFFRPSLILKNHKPLICTINHFVIKEDKTWNETCDKRRQSKKIELADMWMGVVGSGCFLILLWAKVQRRFPN